MPVIRDRYFVSGIGSGIGSGIAKRFKDPAQAFFYRTIATFLIFVGYIIKLYLHLDLKKKEISPVP